MRTVLLILAFALVPSGGANGQLFDVSGTATVHYSGTFKSPVGAGTYFIREGSWGTKISFQTFAADNTETTNFRIDSESKIIVLLPGGGCKIENPVLNAERIGRRTKQREVMAGITYTASDYTFYFEGGTALTLNYQSADVGGETLFRKHPSGYRKVHPSFEIGTAVRLFEHVSAQVGYNYTSGEFPVNHEIVFGIGYTDFPNSWELF